jgi:hypothetical protein
MNIRIVTQCRCCTCLNLSFKNTIIMDYVSPLPCGFLRIMFSPCDAFSHGLPFPTDYVFPRTTFSHGLRFPLYCGI